MRYFISHSTEDDAIADRVFSALIKVGVDAWVDHINKINYGENWQKAIDDAIALCDGGIVLLSPASAISRWCNIEINEIIERKLPLIPVIVHPVAREQIPLILRSTIQRADLSKDFERGLSELVESLASKLSPRLNHDLNIQHLDQARMNDVIKITKELVLEAALLNEMTPVGIKNLLFVVQNCGAETIRIVETKPKTDGA